MLRQKVLDYIQAHGSTKIWFSRQLGISQTHFNLYLSGQRQLSDKLEIALRAIVEKG